MNKQQALQIIGQVCAAYKGTLEEHQQIQNAIKALTADAPEKPDAKPKKS